MIYCYSTAEEIPPTGADELDTGAAPAEVVPGADEADTGAVAVTGTLLLLAGTTGVGSKFVGYVGATAVLGALAPF
jgi:hypothetical protein